LLFRYARAVNVLEPTKSLGLMTEARDALLAAGDHAQAAEAEVQVSEIFWLQGQRDQGFDRLRAAEALIADQPNSYSKAYVVANISRFSTLAGDHETGIRSGREAFAMADELGSDELRSHALNNIGIARVGSGDEGGLEDLEQAVAIAVDANSIESVRSYGNLASILVELGELEQARSTQAEALRLAERFGLGDYTLWIKAEHCWQLYFQGRWDDSLELLDDFIAEFAETGFWMETPLHTTRGRIRLARGDVRGAQEDAERAFQRAEEAKDPQILWPALAFAARAFAATDPDRAAGFASELLTSWQEHGFSLGSDGEWPSDLAVGLVPLGKQAEFLTLVDESHVTTPWRRAAASYVSGDYSAAAGVYAEIGALPEEAYARLRAAEALVGEGRSAEADAELKRSLAFWRSVGATAYVREGEALLAEAS
jgi:tetratricopeptide (TPR) repeat protein